MADKDKTKTSATNGKSGNTSSGTPSYNFEEQSKTVTDKKGNTKTVNVSQISSEGKTSTTITTNTTNKKKTKETLTTEHSSKTYNPSDGYLEQNTSSSTTKTYDKHHNLTKEVRERHETYNKENGALANGLGKADGSKNYERTETDIISLDKKGNITEEEYHIRNGGAQYRLDSTIKYSKKERDEVKQEIRVSAGTSFLRVSSLTKKQKFSASHEKGRETYSIKKGDKTLTVGVNSLGELYGNKATKKEDGTEDVKELSQKQLNKELKAARKQADKNIKAVTEAKNAKELTAAIPSPITIGNPMELNDLFDKPLNREVYEQNTEKLAKDYKERQAQDLQPVAQIMAQKLQNSH